MAKLAAILSRVRIVRERSSTLTKTVVICTIVLSMAALLALGAAINNTRAQTQALKDQAAQLEQENGQLQDKVDKKGTLEGLLEYVQDFLGLVDPDSVIFGSED